jgi:hypothetical protein
MKRRVLDIPEDPPEPPATTTVRPLTEDEVRKGRELLAKLPPVSAPVLEPEVIEADASLLKGRARNIEMFKDYFRGMSVTRIGAKYGLSRTVLHKIKKRDKWDEVAQDIRDREYAALSREHKGLIGKLTSALSKDWERVLRKLGAEDVTLSTDERAHARSLLDSLIKSVRLTDEKPTEIQTTDGTVTHRVLLPPGVTRYGVIPPDKNVEQVEDKGAGKRKPKMTSEDIGDIE